MHCGCLKKCVSLEFSVRLAFFFFFLLNVIVITWARNETKPLWWEIGGGSLGHIKEIFLDLPNDVISSKR